MKTGKIREEWIHLSKPHVGTRERELVTKAFDENWVSTVGPNIDALEDVLGGLHDCYAVALSSGTAAIHLGLRVLGIQPGDEVAVQSLTFAATCNPILYEKAKPVFLDSEFRSMNLDPGVLEDFFNDRAVSGQLPKALITVDLFGQSAEYNAILDLCSRFNVPILEDAAEALGATFGRRKCGTLGDIGVFSLNGNKMITCSSGGILLTKSGEIAERVKKWSSQSRENDPKECGDYWHSEIGFNYRMSNVLAGIAIGQLEVLEDRISRRREWARRYDEKLKDIPGVDVVAEAGYGRHTRWLTCCIVSKDQFGLAMTDLVRALRQRKIDCRPIWKPLHTQPVFREYETIGGSVAERLNREGLCLPSSSNMTIEEHDYVVLAIREIHEDQKL
jgi:dTDP-4-amino-4,6-dideoxygalactose transaminase